MTQRTTKAQRREWHERVTAMPTRADIDRCIECWPKDWEDKCAFHNGQVATLLAEAERQHADNEWLRAREAALVAYIESMATFSPAARIEDIQRKIIEARAALASAGSAEAGEQAAKGEE